MVKRVGGAQLQSIQLDPASPRPLVTQVTVAIRDIILSGGLRAGDRLPATRTLAQELGVSRTTMVEAFERLAAEGLVNSRVGAGTYVSQALQASENSPETTGAPDPGMADGAAGAKVATPRRHGATLPHLAPRLPHTPRAFTTALPAYDMFPLAQWSRLTAKHWRATRDVVLGYGDEKGYAPLRRAIAAHLRANQGIACDDEQVFVVNGAQQAFHVIASALLGPGDAAWFENPGAIGARNALVAAGARLVALPIDAEGMAVERGLDLAPDFRLAFVTPSHQQPLGVTMSLERRFALLRAAEAAGAWIIEDDYDGEFHYGGHPLPTLKSIDRRDRVFYVGTFSKTLFPALRLGYFLAPPSLVAVFEERFRSYLPGVPSNPQAVVAAFMDEGHFATHLRRMRRTYIERHQVFLENAQRHWAGLLDVVPADSGLHTIGHLHPSLSEAAVAEAAEARGITVAPIHRYCLEPVAINGLVLGFSGVPPAQLAAGAESLARVLGALAAPAARNSRQPATAAKN